MTPGDAHRVGVVRPRNPAILPLVRLFLISLCLSALPRARLPSHPADFGVYLCVLAPRPPAAAFRRSARLRSRLSEGYGGVVEWPRGLFASHFAALKNATILRSFDSSSS